MILEKKAQILSIIKLARYLKVSDLQKRLQIPRTSLLRYLDQLQKEGKIIKTFGEVKIRESHLETFAIPRLKAHQKLKNEIAQQVITLVKDDDVIFLDGGSTTYYVANALRDKNITIYTNNLLLVKLLNSDYQPEVHLISGVINKTTLVTASTSSIVDLNKINFDKCFIGFNGFVNQQFSTTNANEAALKEVVIAQTKNHNAYAVGRCNKSKSPAKYIFASSKNLQLITNKDQT